MLFTSFGIQPKQLNIKAPKFHFVSQSLIHSLQPHHLPNALVQSVPCISFRSKYLSQYTFFMGTASHTYYTTQSRVITTHCTSEKLGRILRTHKIRSTFYIDNFFSKLLCKGKNGVNSEAEATLSMKLTVIIVRHSTSLNLNGEPQLLVDKWSAHSTTFLF